MPLLVPPPLHLQMPVSLGGLTSACMHSPGDLCFVALDSIVESPFLLPAWPWSLNSRRPHFCFAARCLRDAFSLAHAQLNPWKHPCSVTPGTPILLLVAQVQSLGIPFSPPSPLRPSANPFPNLVGCLFTPEAESDHIPSFLCIQPGPLPHHSSLGCCRCLRWLPAPTLASLQPVSCSDISLMMSLHGSEASSSCARESLVGLGTVQARSGWFWTFWLTGSTW